jgi:hypothetical protein
MQKVTEKVRLSLAAFAGLLGIIGNSFYLIWPRHPNNMSLKIVSAYILICLIPPALVALGAYIDIIHRKTLGKVILYFSGITLQPLTFLYTVTLGFSGLGAFPIYLCWASALLTILTMILTFLVDGNKAEEEG